MNRSKFAEMPPLVKLLSIAITVGAIYSLVRVAVVDDLSVGAITIAVVDAVILICMLFGVIVRMRFAWWFLTLASLLVIGTWIGISVYLGLRLAFVWELAPMVLARTWGFVALLVCLLPEQTRIYFRIGRFRHSL